MKFKIGQKVRVKDWNEMPERVISMYHCTPSTAIGKIVVISENCIELGEQAYQTNYTDGEEQDYLFFEKELESLIKVGEQLLLFEL